ncbi:MAG: leucine-rich repeat domain-containing protein [Lachnospiraceae bacterium]|nr:leucine-rich repeat domain-containing protein [Lachnospiraceae bacterium]
MELAQKEKAARLQEAVINSSVEALSKVCDEFGEVEMTAPALGLACRFRGLDAVKMLVQKGASFDFPSTTEIEETYNCYVGKKHKNYRTNYSVYLLKAFGEDLMIFCLTGMTMERCARRTDGEELPFLSDAERVEVLRYLLENRERIAFFPEELLFYAIFFGDTALTEELKKNDIGISQKRVEIITEGATAMNGYWFEYILLTQHLADEAYLGVMQQLAAELSGKLFHYTANVYEITRHRLVDIRVFEFFFSHFKKEKMNKRTILCGLVDDGLTEALPAVERAGWLDQPRKRDEIIDYATEKGRTEMLAWLLEYKNRTADLVLEQEKADKKMMRELNMAPDSVAALKKIWSYRKRADGSLFVTNYKGTDTEVTVPEKFGKGIVTAIGDGAFAGDYSGYNIKATADHIRQHGKITALTLPGTIKSIGASAFEAMCALKQINMPGGVREIGAYAFEKCTSLEEIRIPENVKEISAYTFSKCCLLEAFTIPEGTREIGQRAFSECSALKSITIPASVQKIRKNALSECINLETIELNEGVREIDESAFSDCRSLTSIVIPGTAETIGAYAFSGCRRLEAVQIGAGVKEIHRYAFQHCESLKSIAIPESVETIGECAFAYCSRLEEVCICGEVKKIEAIVFHDCVNLKTIKVLRSIPNRILGETFERNPGLAVSCPKGSKTEMYCKKKGIRVAHLTDQ